MTIFKSVVLLTLSLVATVGVGQVLGCDCNCEPLDPMESGDYVIIPRDSDPKHVHPGDEWAVGAELHVDRVAEVATIRYTRDGTTYEVRYTLQ